MTLDSTHTLLYLEHVVVCKSHALPPPGIDASIPHRLTEVLDRGYLVQTPLLQKLIICRAFSMYRCCTTDELVVLVS